MHFDHGRLLVSVRQLHSMWGWVEQIAFGRLCLDDLVGGGTASQRKMVDSRIPPFVGCNGGDGFAIQGDDAVVGSHDVAASADVKRGSSEGAPIYSIRLNDFDASGCGVVIERGDGDRCQISVGGNRYLQVFSAQIRFLGRCLVHVVCSGIK